VSVFKKIEVVTLIWVRVQICRVPLDRKLVEAEEALFCN
jgi:hypothetical protein